MIGYLYILQSEANGRYYVGSTGNISTRFTAHNKGKSKYTSMTKPFSLVFKQKYSDIISARKAERWIKKQKSKGLIEKLIKDGVFKKKNFSMVVVAQQ